ncbi:MAG TPA: hypothetical protein VMN60_08765 [Longimicrobiales bacterium]|nr:hypothetical protein [Longimicrobiales bacterium]
MKYLIEAMVIGAGLLAGARAHAQEPPQLQDARAALAACVAVSDSNDDSRAGKDRARAAYERARQLFREAIAAQPNSAGAHAGLGETISRCGIPLANMLSIMGVVEESTAALETALQLDPRHWTARFTLALNSYHMPSFLNRMGEAIRQLEILLQQQGGRSDQPHFALTYLYLGDAYRKAHRRADAHATYTAGARLFPDHAALQQRARDAGGITAAADPVAVPSPAAAQPSILPLSPLRVDAQQHQLEEARSGTSLRRLDVYTMPGGTAELLQTLQTLPGVTRAGDGADLHVRGGDPEETPIFVNGGRLAFPGRWEGLHGSTMGVLDANVLSRAYFSAGGFSAKYGNALSGVVDVETQGRPAQTRVRAAVNMVSVGASMFRPVSDHSGAWGSVMLTDVRLVAATQGRTAMYPDMPQSYQAVIGGAAHVTSRLELKALALAAGDRSARMIDVGAHHGAFASQGSTQHVALSARWLSANDRAGIHASVTGSRRSGGYDFGVLSRDRVDNANGIRIDGDVIAGSGARVRAGIEYGRLAATTTGAVPATGRLAPGSPVHVLDSERAHATHLGGYAEAEQGIGPLVLVAGMRVDELPGEDGVTLDPRGAVAYTAGTWTVRAGAGTFHQGRWRRTYRLPDSGVPAGEPTRARHVVIGAERSGEPAVRVEAYRKQYDGHVADADHALDIAAGDTRGIDAIVRWQRQERLNGWLTYSFIDAQLELLNGERAPARFDITHSLTAVTRLALGAAWEVGSTVRYATGRPYTPVVGVREPARQGWPPAPLFGAAGSERVPDYFRVDGRITRYQRFGDTALGVFYLEMLDLNGRANVMAYQYDETYSVKTPVESFFARRTLVLGAELSF